MSDLPPIPGDFPALLVRHGLTVPCAGVGSSVPLETQATTVFAFRGILAQRLVRVICPSCKEQDPSAADKEELRLLGIGADVPLSKGRGCERCAFTGFFGRLGIFELLVVNDDIRRLILKNSDANEIRKVARQHGMNTLMEDGTQKIKEGTTTLSEVLRVTQEA